MLNYNGFQKTLFLTKKKKRKKKYEDTYPVPGGPANRTALPAIFLLLINSAITPQACRIRVCTINKSIVKIYLIPAMLDVFRTNDLLRPYK